MTRQGTGVFAWAALAALALAHGACWSAVECDDMARTSLTVEVREKGSTAVVCGATVTAEQDGSLETLKEHDCLYSGLLERSGEFVVSAKKQGYLEATAAVTIGTNECGPVPRKITIALTPE